MPEKQKYLSINFSEIEREMILEFAHDESLRQTQSFGLSNKITLSGYGIKCCFKVSKKPNDKRSISVEVIYRDMPSSEDLYLTAWSCSDLSYILNSIHGE